MVGSCCGHVAERHKRLRPSVGYLATGPLRVMEARLADRTIGRRKRRILGPVEKRAIASLARLFRVESTRVLELMSRAKLPYTPIDHGPEFRAAVAEAPRLDPAVEAELDELMRLLVNGQNVASYQADINGLYLDVMPKAMDEATFEAMAARGIGIRGKLARFPRAEQWIRDHAITFGEKYAADVTEATNAAIRNQLATGFSEFESVEQMMGRVRKVYTDATRYRAERIVRTETNRAYTSASHEAYQQLGVEGKYSIISGSEYAVLPEICAVNAERGTIPMSDSFEDIWGDPCDGPPYHPNCLCDLGIDIAPDWEPPDWVEEV